jgi:ABC-type lipoprotein export system ATPase subunit
MITLSQVGKTYTLDQNVPFDALKNISLTIKAGEFCSIVGPSGSGKSTLMHIIGLLDKPTHGKVEINGTDISKANDNKLSTMRNEFIGFVFQQFNLINKLTVTENVLLPTIYAHRKLDYDPNSEVLKLLIRFGIDSKANSYPNRISGGQQQRVAIARSLVMKPKLILADEPTGNLDTKTGDDIISLLTKLNREDGITVVIVTHDPKVAAKTKRIIKIKDGEIER